MDPRVLEAKDFQVRNYHPSDRESVRAICCETGFLGNPIDPVFEDRELFADFLTDYYLKHEPDSAFVVIKDNVVKGYLLGSRHPLSHQVHSLLQNVIYGGKVLSRYLGYQTGISSIHPLDGFKSVARSARCPSDDRAFSCQPSPGSEVHPGLSVELLETYFRYLHDHGVKQVHAQMVTFDGRRGFKLFERYGFKVLNQSEITKYRQFTDQSVYLCTIVKEFEEQSERLLYPVR